MKMPNIQKWDGPDAITCARALADKPYTIFLDSNRASHPLNQWSFIAFDPIERIAIKNNVITHDGRIIEGYDFFGFLQSRLDNCPCDYNGDIPFIGGFAGYFGYDLGRTLETLPDDTQDILNMPDACLGLYTNVLAFNHHANEAWYIGDNAPNIAEQTPQQYEAPHAQWQSNKTDNDYCNDVQKIIDYIYAGEIYQANLSRAFTTKLPTNFNSFSHYDHLRNINPAPFSAYLNFGDTQILSCSPEQFLNVKNKRVTTCPIKGTLSAEENSDILLNSEKDRAENIMIVDLLRNDLSKICKENTVTVPQLCEIETFENLHHLVSKVTGVMRDDKTALDLLKSCFPGGSITGAPKIRAQEIIEEIEETKRGAYCGAIGYIGFNGAMDTSIVIRTLIVKDGTATLQLGSGIVSDSTPQSELSETYTKGAKIFESFKT